MAAVICRTTASLREKDNTARGGEDSPICCAVRVFFSLPRSRVGAGMNETTSELPSLLPPCPEGDTAVKEIRKDTFPPLIPFQTRNFQFRIPHRASILGDHFRCPPITLPGPAHLFSIPDHQPGLGTATRWLWWKFLKYQPIAALPCFAHRRGPGAPAARCGVPRCSMAVPLSQAVPFEGTSSSPPSGL